MKKIFRAPRSVFAKYNFISLLKIGINLFLTKVFFSSARLIRHPFYIRGRCFIDIGINLTTGIGCRLDAFPIENKIVLKFGNNVEINDYVHIGAIENVTIGNNVLIASKVFITDHNHGSYAGKLQDTPNSIISI